MKRLLWTAAVLALVTALGAGVACWWGWQRLNEAYRGYPGDRLETVIDSGIAAEKILEQLAAEGVLRDAWLARLYLVEVLEDPPLKAGEYAFDGPLSPIEVLAKLTRGEVSTHPVTLIEGLTLEETATVLSDSGFGDRDLLLATMRDPRRIADLDAEANDLEGYLFPDTYSFARGTTEAEIVDALVANFRRRLRSDLGTLEPGTLRPRVILASIIEKEAQLASERPLISAVFTNRLRRGVALAADPTVIYAMKLEGRWDGNIRKGDLKMESPYNTYVHAGLPPGPICSAGLASLRAAFSPAESEDLYFVSRNDGSHVFARTLSEHNRNVQRWQVEYWRRKWAEGK